ncbi:hypothetical protein QE152_g15299 [Popillia japonica]|uniref:Retrotransposon gag domain-containing protein n=1 Tax=Popillia japonica TaxID=7064 RepID=A0AAW1L8J4_POPJA
MATSESVGMLQRLEGAFKVFKEPEYTAYLLHYIGAKAFDVLCDKINPKDPYTEQYSVLKTALEDFYAPAPLEIAENFRFHQRRQEEGETLQDYIVSLQKLSINCKLGDYLKTALRNQEIVFGLQSRRIQSRLLESADLTFDRAVKNATGMELCEKDAQQLNNPSTVRQDTPEINSDDDMDYNFSENDTNDFGNAEGTADLTQLQEQEQQPQMSSTAASNSTFLKRERKLPRFFLGEKENKFKDYVLE